VGGGGGGGGGGAGNRGKHKLVYEVGGQEALAAAAPFCALRGQVGAASLGAGDT
jgi:hypothetical protein